jgi:hypothetical protein
MKTLINTTNFPKMATIQVDKCVKINKKFKKINFFTVLSI